MHTAPTRRRVTNGIQDTLLTHMMGVGGVTNHSAAYRVRTAREVEVRLAIGTRADLRDAVLTPPTRTHADDDCTGGAVITGLLAKTRYFYRVLINGVATSSVASFKTAPEPHDPHPFSFAWASCQVSPSGTPIFASIRSEEIDLFGHLGDFGYPRSTDLAIQYANYRTQYGGDFQAQIVEQVGRFHIYDDADYGGNQANGGLPGKGNAMKAFSDFIPLYPLPNPSGRWHSWRWGKLAEGFVLDVRSQRQVSRPKWPDGPKAMATADLGSGGTILKLRAADKPRSGLNAYRGYYADFGDYVARVISQSGRTCMLSIAVPSLVEGKPFFLRRASMLDMDLLPDGQTEWLIASVAKSDALFKFIFSSIVWNPTYKGSDSWGGWSPSNGVEQRYIVHRLREVRAQNIIMGTADRHVLAVDDGTNSIYPEFSASPLNAPSYSVSGSWTGGVYDRGHGYALARVETDRVTLTPKDRFGKLAVGMQPLIVQAA
jgi:phosphodiesterase/alkaline phosphatase D-like protein